MKTTLKLRLTRFDESQDGMMWSIEVGDGKNFQVVSGTPDKFSCDIFATEMESELTEDGVHKLFELLCYAMNFINRRDIDGVK